MSKARQSLYAWIHREVPSAKRLVARVAWSLSRGEARPLITADERAMLHHMPIVGADGYLFHQDHDAIDQLTGALRFHDSQLAVWTQVLLRRAEWCERHGAVFREMIIPEKHVVYADKLPRSIRLSKRRAALQILGALEDSIRPRVLYPVEELRAAGDRQPTFFKTDTHWSSFGAYIGYAALVKSLGQDMDAPLYPVDAIEYVEKRYVGDLGVRFAVEREESASFLKRPAQPAPIYQNHNFGRGAVHIYESADRTLPTCVLFRDSFSNALIPFLAQNFSRIVAVSSMSYFYDLLEQERPDVVLSITIERFLATFGQGATLELPEDLLPGRTFAGSCGTELETLKPTRSESVAE